MATIVVITSNSPYEQWLVGRLVVFVMWQWWRPTLLVGGWGLLLAGHCCVRTEPITALQAAARSLSARLVCCLVGGVVIRMLNPNNEEKHVVSKRKNKGTLNTYPRGPKQHLEIVTGNPWIFFRYPYPHPSKPLPLVEGTGLQQVRVWVPGGWEGTHTHKGNAHGSAVHRRH
jgi:hypothetical protein